jgi:peptidoglycan/LPS O-acetylase OafA/YrhL
MRLIGRPSYSLYLVHVSIIMFLVERMAMSSGTFAFNLAYVGVCLPTALAMHYGWERWFLKLKDHLKPSVGPWPAIAMWTAVGVGATAYLAK